MAIESLLPARSLAEGGGQSGGERGSLMPRESLGFKAKAKAIKFMVELVRKL